MTHFLLLLKTIRLFLFSLDPIIIHWILSLLIFFFQNETIPSYNMSYSFSLLDRRFYCESQRKRSVEYYFSRGFAVCFLIKFDYNVGNTACIVIESLYWRTLSVSINILIPVREFELTEEASSV